MFDTISCFLFVTEFYEDSSLKIQQMLGFHKRAIDKLDEELREVKDEHAKWLDRQDKETNEWHAERKDLNQKI